MPLLVAIALFCLFGLLTGFLPPRTQPMPTQAAAASKVVIEAPVLSTFVAADGGIDHVAGISTFVRNFEGAGIFGRLFPEIRTLPLVSLAAVVPDPERLLWLKPQAVVAWAGQAENLRATGFSGIVEMRYDSRSSLERCASN